jgi:hypothetical protein
MESGKSQDSQHSEIGNYKKKRKAQNKISCFNYFYFVEIATLSIGIGINQLNVFPPYFLFFVRFKIIRS